ncbi:MAG: lipopolysaccharide biosynthesis protein [Bacteroidales bacterium]
MSSVKQLFSQSFVYGLSTVLPKLLNFFLVFIHTRVLVDPVQYGIVSELYAYITFLLILLTFGLETGFFRFVNKNEDKSKVYSTVFYFLLLTSALASFLFVGFSDSISSSLGTVYDPLYISTLGIVISLDAFMALPFAKLRSENRPILFSTIKILGVVINIVLNLFFFVFLTPDQLQSLIPHVNILYFIFLSNLIQNVLTVLVLLYFTHLPKFDFDYSLLKKILKYSLPLLLAGLTGTTNEAFDRIFLKYLLPQESNPLYQLGIYGANYKLAVLLMLFIQMYRFAAEPFFFNLQGSKNSLEVYGKALKYFIVFCLIIFLFITFNLPLFKYYVGSEYRQSLFIVPILLIANILNGTFFNLSFWYKLSDKTLYGVKYTAVGATLTIVSNILLIPILGIYGAALARVICYLVMNILSYRDGRFSGYISLDKSHLKKYIILFITIFIIATILFFTKPIFAVVFINISLLYFVYEFIKTEHIQIPYINRFIR